MVDTPQQQQLQLPKQAGQPQQVPQNRPPPTPQMRQIGLEVQTLTQQLQQAGGPQGGNPQQTRPIIHRIQMLKQQYSACMQQQLQSIQQQQQQTKQAHQAAQLQAQQQGQGQGQVQVSQTPQVQNTGPVNTAGPVGQAVGTPSTNAATAPQVQTQLDAILGAAPAANATPQMQAQWREQQQRVQQLLRYMSELKTKIQGLKEETANPQLPADQRQAKQADMADSIRRFQQYQQVLVNAGRSVRAQQAGQQQQQQGQQQAQMLQQAQQSKVANVQTQQPPQAQQAQQAQQIQQQAQESNSSPVQPAISLSANAVASANATLPALAAAANAQAQASTPGQLAASQTQSQQQATNSPGIARPGSATLNATPTPLAPAVAPVAKPIVPQQVPAGRPTLSNGYTGAPSVSSPALAKAPATIPFDPSARMLGKRNLSTLLGTIDPSEKLDPDVEDILLDVADEFIESVVNFSCKLAKHRKSDALGTEDVKLVLEKDWNIRVMGFADERTDVRRRTGKEGTREYRSKLQAVSSAKSLQ